MNMKPSQQSFKTAFCYLLISTGIMFGNSPVYSETVPTSASKTSEIKLTPKWIERYLFKNFPELVRNTHLDHVLSFYYFGSYKDFTIMGMERVKGDDYYQHNTVLIFKNAELKGYYEALQVLPSKVTSEGLIEFPANNDVEDNINLKEGYYPAMVFSRDKKLNPDSHAVSEIQWVNI
jgi:hypothetical protein